MSIEKLVGFRGPYAPKTLQRLTRLILGADGYLGGAVTTDDGANVTVGPYQFVQNGIVVAESVLNTVMAIPVVAEPWFVLAATVDDDPNTGAAIRVTGDVAELAGGAAIVLAYKSNGVWKNPVSGTAVAGGVSASVPGRDGGLDLVPFVGGALTGVKLRRGQVVDPDGIRRTLRSKNSCLATAAMDPAAANELYGRNDYMILRQRETGTAEVVSVAGIAKGVAAAAVTLVDAAAGTKPSFFPVPAYPTTAWGNGTNLRVKNSGSNATLAGSGGAIDNVWIAGIRAADGAILIVYTDGDHVMLAAVAYGAFVDGPVRIDTQANACSHVRAVSDRNGILHVVYEHNEGGGPPTQQVYYTKRIVTTGGTFGNAALAPRIANVVNSTKNDTWPSLGVDRRGRAYIAFATGTGANQFGDLRYIVYDETGTFVSKTTYTDQGGFAIAACGLTSKSLTSIKKPVVTVSPHDEINVFAMADLGSGFHDVTVFNPTFKERLTFNMVWLDTFFASSATRVLNALGAVVDSSGQFVIQGNFATDGLMQGRLDTTIAAFGMPRDGYLEQDVALDSAMAAAVDISSVLDESGSVRIAYQLGAAAKLDNAPGTVGGKAFTPHVKDLYLGVLAIDSDPGLSGGVPADGYQLFATRPKRLNYPFLVGDEGDYRGYGSIEAAVADANRRGGKVVVRSGHYHISPIVLQSGVSLVGDGNVVLTSGTDTLAGPLITVGPFGTLTPTAISGQIVTFDALDKVGSRARPGDLVVMATSGLHRVRRVVDSDRLALDGVVPVGATCVVFSCGNVLENIAIAGAATAAPLLYLHNVFAARIRSVQMLGSLTSRDALSLLGGRDCVIEEVDFTGSTGNASTFGATLAGGLNNQVLGCRFGNANGQNLKIMGITGGEELHPKIVHCQAPTGGTAAYLIKSTGGRTTDVTFIGCTGDLDAAGLVDRVHTQYGHIDAAIDLAYDIGGGSNRFHRVTSALAVNGPGGDGAEIIRTLTAPTGQVAALEVIAGVHGIQTDYIDAFGHRIVAGKQFHDEFQRADIDSTSLWTWAAAGGGATGTKSIDGANVAKLAASVNGDKSTATSYAMFNAVRFKTVFRTIFKASVPGTAFFEFGLGEASANDTGVRFFIDTFDNNNFKLHVRRTSNTNEVFDTGVSHASLGGGPWYLMFAVISTTQIFWQIGDASTDAAHSVNSQLGASAGNGVFTLGASTIKDGFVPIVLRTHAESNDLATGFWEFVDVFETSRTVL